MAAGDPLGNLLRFPAFGLGPDVSIAFVRVDVGASGAPTVTGHTNAISVAYVSSGKYTVTTPDVSANYKGSIFVWIAKSTTVELCKGEAESPTTGTYTIQFVASETPTDTEPASGDVFFVFFVGEASGS